MKTELAYANFKEHCLSYENKFFVFTDNKLVIIRKGGFAMPIEKIVDYYIDNTKDNYIKMKLATNCAPLLKNIKESSMVMLPKEYDVQIFVKETNILCKKLYQCGDKNAWFLYRKEALKELLLIEGNTNFLKMCGYVCLTNVYDYISDEKLEEILDFQSERLEKYTKEKAEFPHEIGILLGYPIKDVEGFIQNKGENYKYSGYWKVYDNPNKMISLFKTYDMAKEQAVRQVLSGKNLKDIAV